MPLLRTAQSLLSPCSHRLRSSILTPHCRATCPPSFSFSTTSTTNTLMTRPKIVLTRSLPTSLLADAEKRGEIDLVAWPHAEKAAERDWILENVKGAAGLAVMLSDKVDRELLTTAGPSLKVISTLSVGFDHIDVPYCYEKGIRIGYTPSVLNEAVSDLTLLLILGITRQLPLATRVVREGRWKDTPISPMAFTGPSLKGKTIGFFGFGGIAQTVALRLADFEVGKILYKTSRERPFDVDDEYFTEFRSSHWEDRQALREKCGGKRIVVESTTSSDELARNSDLIIVLASLSASTKHAISTSFFEKMKSTAHIVNVSRGPLIHTEALVEALKNGKIAGAALDVLEGEPNISQDHPLLADAEVRDKVFLLPHIGSANIETRMRMSALTEENALAGAGIPGAGYQGVEGKMEFELR